MKIMIRGTERSVNLDGLLEHPGGPTHGKTIFHVDERQADKLQKLLSDDCRRKMERKTRTWMRQRMAESLRAMAEDVAGLALTSKDAARRKRCSTNVDLLLSLANEIQKGRMGG